MAYLCQANEYGEMECQEAFVQYVDNTEGNDTYETFYMNRPTGSYLKSCHSCRWLDEFTYSCACFDTKGRLKRSALVPLTCKGTNLDNINGNLKCNGVNNKLKFFF